MEHTNKNRTPMKKRLVVGICISLCVGQAAAYEAYSTKKGVGVSLANGPALQKSRVESLHSSWYYSWGIDRNAAIDPTIEYVPMKWGGNNLPDAQDEAQMAADLAACFITGYAPVTHFLGFNEPDHTEQSNMTVQQMLTAWPSLETVCAPDNLLLGSAAMTGFHQMQQDFMAQAIPQGRQVDFMAYHQYPGMVSGVDNIMNQAQSYYNAYGKDVWITEFNVADWVGNKGYTQEQSYTWMAELLYRLESTPYIARYAIFPWDKTWAAGYASYVFEIEVPSPGVTNITSTLSPLGKLYADYHTDDIDGPYTETWYYLHNKSSHQRLSDNVSTPATANVYEESSIVDFKLVDAGNGNSFIVNKNSGDRLGYNGSALYMANATTTDSSVQWSVSESLNGWKFISHVGTGNRLSGNPLGLVPSSTSDDTVKWTFARSHLLPPVASILIGGSVNNGDFNNPDLDANFDQLASWDNIGTGASTINATKVNNTYDGSRHAVVGYQPNIKIFGADTGHTIAEGDVFNISYVWKDGWLWTDTSDQVRVSLFVTADNTLTGARTDLVSDLSGLSSQNDTYEEVDHDGIYTAVAADAGKTLFVAIDATIDDESYAHMDNFELSVIDSAAANSAPAFTADPILAADGFEGAAYSATIAGSATDVDAGDILSYSKAVLYGPTWLNIAADGTLSGTPGFSDTGTNYWIVQVDDGNGEVGEIDTAVLSIYVEPNGNIPPVFTVDPINKPNVLENADYNESIAGDATDANGDPLTFSRVAGPAWLDILGNGSITGTPTVIDVGPNNWTVQVSDNNGGIDTAELNIFVNSLAPMILVGGSTLNGDFNNPNTDANFDLLADWVNIGTGASTINATKNNNAYDGTMHAVVGYLPGAKIFGLDTGYPIVEGDVFDISYVWKDGWLWTDSSDQIRVSLFVTDDNTINGVRTDLVSDLSGLSTLNATYEAVDHNGIYTAAPADTGKILFIAIDANITDESYGHMDNFEVIVTSAGAPANNPPVAVDDNGITVTEDVALSIDVLANDSDPDGHSLSIYSVTQGAQGTVTINGSLVDYSPALNVTGADSFTYVVTDGSLYATGTVSLTINAVNDAPTADAQSVSLSEDGSLLITLTGSDIENDPLTYAVQSGPANGVLSGAAPNLTYTPNADYNGSDSFTFIANDNVANSAAATVSITVNPANDAPVFSSDPISTANASEGVAYSDSIAGTATDIDSGDTLSYSKDAGDPAWLTVASDGTLSGTPGTGDVGLNTFTITVDDNQGGVDTATLNITVDAAPSGPVTVFTDNFESAADWTSEWASYGAWARKTTKPHDGSYSTEIDGNVTDSPLVSRSIDVTGKSSATITFWWFIEQGLDTGEYLAFDTDTGSGFTQQAIQQGNVDLEGSWVSKNIVVDVSGTDTLTLRFRGKMNKAREDAYLDEVQVVAQ
jgi:hypothetical protein